jgi:hypothetical protein
MLNVDKIRPIEQFGWLDEDSILIPPSQGPCFQPYGRHWRDPRHESEIAEDFMPFHAAILSTGGFFVSRRHIRSPLNTTFGNFRPPAGETIIQNISGHFRSREKSRLNALKDVRAAIASYGPSRFHRVVQCKWLAEQLSEPPRVRRICRKSGRPRILGKLVAFRYDDAGRHLYEVPGDKRLSQ